APATRAAVQHLAFLGNVTPIATLALVHGPSLDEAMWEAVRAGLVFRGGDRYGFLHDRVQAAGYALVPEAERAGARLRLHRLLAERLPPGKRDEAIFDIVNQYNRASAAIATRAERDLVAELNLVAGQQARAATAYATALTYFAAGRSLLADDAWD